MVKASQQTPSSADANAVCSVQPASSYKRVIKSIKQESFGNLPNLPRSVVLMEPEGGGPPELTWLGDGQWLEASFACLGDVGTMRVLQPTLRVRHADRDGNLQVQSACDAVLVGDAWHLRQQAGKSHCVDSHCSAVAHPKEITY